MRCKLSALLFTIILLPLLLALPSAYGQSSQEVLAQAGQNPKLRASAEALAPLAADGGQGSFIVMLVSPRNALPADALGTEQGKAAVRAQTAAALAAFLDRRQAADTGTVTRRFDYMPAFTATLTAEQLAALLASGDVASIEENAILTPHLRQGIPLMNAAATRSLYRGAGIAVAICDTGIDYKNPYLGGGLFPNAKVIGGRDVGMNRDDPMDKDGHGTACAGIVAGLVGDVGDYIGGVVPDAKLYAVKISTSDTGGSASNDSMIAGWEWCLTHQNDAPANPIRIISTSFGGDRYASACDGVVPAMTTAAANAVAAGITIFASSGNDGYCDSMGWPACISHVISVGAVYDAAFGNYSPCVSVNSCVLNKLYTSYCTNWYVNDATAADMVTSYSNSASFLTLFAPSNQAYTLQCAYKESGTFNQTFGGTSAACPYAAGAAAALQSAAKARTGSYLTPAQVRSALTTTGVAITDSKVAVTKPRVNLQAAINTLPNNVPSASLLPLGIPAAIRARSN
ncbi:S8 family serine peptidase [Solidesulfovibrio sp.]